MIDDLKDYEARTGEKPFEGLEGETICPGCGNACPARWEVWTEGVLMMTFACTCGTALELEEAA